MEALPQYNLPGVLGVLDRIKDSIENSEHVLILGKNDVELGSVGTAYSGSIQLGRAIASAMSQPEVRIPGDSARSISTTLKNCILVYLLGKDLKVVLIGPQDWNIALTTRIVDRFLSDFIDEFLAEWVNSAPTTYDSRSDGTSAVLTQRSRLLEEVDLAAATGDSDVEIYSNRDVLNRVLFGLEAM